MMLDNFLNSLQESRIFLSVLKLEFMNARNNWILAYRNYRHGIPMHSTDLNNFVKNPAMHRSQTTNGT